ncbi:hypothetical protein IE53DRAFT_409686 [Violaceomyces palustris]|uniref:Uncharacterized protein n=1 Tax=Violaceomyces palustris TaxID=1673888 RepID=A0ACD0P232_9BASI|nr:hypothetical protein IE53DRAFT_409686 [Violaceomyces palustris]
MARDATEERYDDSTLFLLRSLSKAQAGIDGIIPVYAGDLDEPFANEVEEAEKVRPRMSFIAWQAKLRDRPIATKQCFHGPVIADRPERLGLMTILLEMGVSQGLKRGSEGRISDRISLKPEPCLGKCSLAGIVPPTLHHPLLSIRGMEKSTFPCLAKLRVEGAFHEMLSKSSEPRAQNRPQLAFQDSYPLISMEGNLRPSTED